MDRNIVEKENSQPVKQSTKLIIDEKYRGPAKITGDPAKITVRFKEIQERH